ncbi:MAG: DNA polymerase I [bacterium]
MSENTPPAKVPLVLVDGSSYLYRAYHALPPLTSSKGVPTGAVKGVVSMLKRLVSDYPGSPVVVVFDAKGKTFRDDLYENYKSHRPPMPDDLRQQIEPIHQLVEALGLPMLIESGVEADDVIGTLATRASEAGTAVVISTGDKDMAQLVDDRVTIVNTMTGSRWDRQGVIDKFGVPPEFIIDYLALTGDKSDNIPGVAGVGDKTAVGLIQGIGGLESIFGDLEKVRTLSFRGAKTMPEKLEKSRDDAFLSYQLATIKTDVALDTEPDQLHNGEPDRERLIQLYSDLEFKAWLEELLNDTSESAVQTGADAIDVHYETVLDETHLDAWLAKLEAAEYFAFDTETTSLNYMEAELVGISVAVEEGSAAYIPVAHDYLGAPAQLSRALLLKKLKPLLENPERSIVGQNLKYDSSVLARYDVQLAGARFDTMLESYVIDSVGSRHDMDSLALKYLAHKNIKFEDIAGKGASQLTFNQIDLEQASPYAAEDADITLRLHNKLWPKLSEEQSLRSVFETIEMPLMPVLSKMERAGALIDTGLLGKQSAELATRITELEAEAHDLAGQPFNLASPKQLGEILFEKLKIPVVKKTAKGAPSTKEEVLQELALDYPLPKVILEHRSLSKLKSTYTDKLPQMVNAATGRVHTSYHQAVTATGRLSSSDPNLQNIPIRTPEGRRIRQAFIAPSGYKLMAADYSQIELRIMAHLSGDEGLIDAFRHGRDIHSATAAEVFGVSLDDVSTEQRRNAKAINFGLIYGMSAFGLARQLKIGRNQAQEYIDLYFSRYPGVRQYMDQIREQAKEKGYVETLGGRRLYLPEINASNGMRRQAAERTAINAPMQGTAADIIKLSMIEVQRWLDNANNGAKMIMQVHDELVLEVPEDQIEAVESELRSIMATAMSLDVPLVVDVGVGDNWDQAH